jgi:mono/diheme cytochrome c family protein
METRIKRVLSSGSLVAAVAAAATGLASCGGGGGGDDTSTSTDPAVLASGQQIFRHDTFGDEIFWSDTLQMHHVIDGSTNPPSPGVSPRTALAVGFKVDVDALPPQVKTALANGQVNLDDSQTTLTLIELKAVIGLEGTVTTDANNVKHLQRLGVTCAVCHSTVDDSFAKGIGHRLDGWPNRDFNSGAVVALSPVLTPAQKAVYNSWGPGKYDARFNFDGINKPTVIPPAYGLRGVDKITVTGDGDNVEYWNRYVAVTQLGGQGTFSEPRLNINVAHGPADLTSSALPALQAYQLSLAAPKNPANLDAASVARGQALFAGKAQCATCHSGPQFTDANLRLHPVSDSVTGDATTANRSATKLYRTSPLPGVWQHAPYFHDGSSPTLQDVVARYNAKMTLGLTAQEMADVATYLSSL